METTTTNDYASKGVANAGLATGIVGATLGVLNGGLGMLNGGVGGGSKLNELMMENATLKADAATDKKLVEVYTELRKQGKEQESEVSDLKARVTAIEVASPLREQILTGRIGEVATLAQNGIATNTAAIQNLAATVNNITKTVVPITAVCPQPMPQYNSWTAPTTPTTAG